MLQLSEEIGLIGFPRATAINCGKLLLPDRGNVFNFTHMDDLICHLLDVCRWNFFFQGKPLTSYSILLVDIAIILLVILDESSLDLLNVNNMIPNFAR